MPFKVQTLGISNAATLLGLPKTGDMLTFHAYSEQFILSILTSAIRGTRPVYMTEIPVDEVKDGEWYEPFDPKSRLIGGQVEFCEVIETPMDVSTCTLFVGTKDEITKQAEALFLECCRKCPDWNDIFKSDALDSGFYQMKSGEIVQLHWPQVVAPTLSVPE